MRRMLLVCAIAAGAACGGKEGGGKEAELQLSRIGKAARTSYIEKARFPIGNTDLTPAKDCCATGGECKTTPSAWTGPWSQLKFDIDYHALQYSYESDGKTFTAKAVGCGDHAGTWSISGRVEAGNVVIDAVSKN